MSEIIETIIIGGGQAGLATSYYLKQHGCEHVVLEQAAQAGNAWRNDRWDSFTLLTPNWSFRLPGAEYQGEGRDGFMAREEIVARFEQYVEGFHLPVRYGARVTSVEPAAGREGYRVGTGETVLHARNVVIASGLYQKPKKPPFSTAISSRITQVASGQYRNPQTLAEGAVLVVGSGQSGCQIAEELYLSGRKVYLCTGIAPRVPRRYRGKDIYEWFHLSGFLDRTTDQLTSPAARFDANPQLTGRDGGRSLNLHQFARDGVALLGRLQGAREEQAWLAPDLQQNLAKADQKEADIVKMVDGYIARSGLEAPAETLPVLRDGYEARGDHRTGSAGGRHHDDHLGHGLQLRLQPGAAAGVRRLRVSAAEARRDGPPRPILRGPAVVVQVQVGSPLRHGRGCGAYCRGNCCQIGEG